MTVALVSCLVVNSFWHAGIEAGFAWYLVAAYLITLVAETLFVVIPAQTQSDSPVRQREVPKGPAGTGLVEGELYG
jgi:hypothetical protein